MTPEQKERYLTAGLKWGLGLVAVGILAPFILSVVTGLLGLAAAGIIGLICVYGAEPLSRVLATLALKGNKAMARANPVETRQAISMKSRERLKATLDAIGAFRAEVLNVEGHMRTLYREGDNEGGQELQRTYDGLRAVLERREAAYQSAMRAADEYDKVTEKVGRRWKAAQAALKAKRLAGPAASAELDKILSEEAVESADTAMNQVFAELEQSMLEMPAIEHSPSPAIEVPVRVVESVRA